MANRTAGPPVSFFLVILFVLLSTRAHNSFKYNASMNDSAASLGTLPHHPCPCSASFREIPYTLTQAGEEALQLMSVLGRDLQGSFFPFFPRVSTVLVGLIAPPDVAPEVCGRVLRCLGFLMKFVARPLSKDMSSVRATYAPLLGHTRDFARKMAAQSLAPAVRRLKPKAMRRHAKQLVAALASGAVAAGADDAAGGARLRADTLDGCSQLLFFVAKGVHGRTHSQVGCGRRETGQLDSCFGCAEFNFEVVCFPCECRSPCHL